MQNFERADTDLQVNTEGEVRARTEVDIVSQVVGRIVSVISEFTEGGLVESDVSLVEIEDLDYKPNLAPALARIAAAKVGVQTALATTDLAKKQLRNARDSSLRALKLTRLADARR